MIFISGVLLYGTKEKIKCWYPAFSYFYVRFNYAVAVSRFTTVRILQVRSLSRRKIMLKETYQRDLYLLQ